MASWYPVLQSLRHICWIHLSCTDRITWSNTRKDHINSIFSNKYSRTKQRQGVSHLCLRGISCCYLQVWNSFSLLLLLLFMFSLLLKENPWRLNNFVSNSTFVFFCSGIPISSLCLSFLGWGAEAEDGKLVNILSSHGAMNKKSIEISGKIKCNYSMKTYNSISDALCFWGMFTDARQ